jgi:hypothetical protein
VSNKLFRHLRLAGALAGFLAAVPQKAAPQSAETKLQGVLIDRMCSSKAESRIAPGPRLEGGILEAYIHTKHCALMPECQKSGYGVFTYDNKFVAFDGAGSQKALAFFKQSNKEDDFRVEVTGQMQGDVMKVASIKLLP